MMVMSMALLIAGRSMRKVATPSATETDNEFMSATSSCPGAGRDANCYLLKAHPFA